MSVEIMPSPTHEAIIELFRRRPPLAKELLGDALVIAPDATATVADSALSDPTMVERSADLVLIFEGARAGPVCVIVETQLREDPDKRDAWWGYLVAARRRHRCPCVLAVVTPVRRVARWAREPIDLGHPGLVLTPLVIGPDDIPVVIDEQLAVHDPELAVLSALAHGRGKSSGDVARAAFAAVRPLDDERGRVYTDVVMASLGAVGRAIFEGLMGIENYEYQSDFAKRYYAKGKAEGKAEGQAEGEAKGKALAVIAILETRGLSAPPEVRERIVACRDLPTLDRWLGRALTAATAAGVIDG
jgi:hypothetical protein